MKPQKQGKPLKPRKGLVALLRKGGVHQRRDKCANRALQKRQHLKRLTEG